jgi:hypothetical protein
MISAFNLDRALATKHESLIGRAMQRQAKAEGHFKGAPKKAQTSMGARADGTRSLGEMALAHLQSIAPARMILTDITKAISGSDLPTSRYSVKYALQGLINRGLIQHRFYRRNLIEYWFEQEEDL